MLDLEGFLNSMDLTMVCPSTPANSIEVRGKYCGKFWYKYNTTSNMSRASGAGLAQMRVGDKGNSRPKEEEEEGVNILRGLTVWSNVRSLFLPRSRMAATTRSAFWRMCSSVSGARAYPYRGRPWLASAGKWDCNKEQRTLLKNKDNKECVSLYPDTSSMVHCDLWFEIFLPVPQIFVKICNSFRFRWCHGSVVVRQPFEQDTLGDTVHVRSRQRWICPWFSFSFGFHCCCSVGSR